jgi:hypothetical protein
MYETRSRDWISATHAIRLTTKAYHAEIDALDVAPDDSAGLMQIPGCHSSRYMDAVTIEQMMQAHHSHLQACVEAGGGMLWWRQGLVPLADKHLLYMELPEQPESGEVISSLLRDYWGYSQEQLKPWHTACGCEQALIIRSLASMVDDPVWHLAQVNAKIKMGGRLVLSLLQLDIPIVENTEMKTMSAWTLALECAGFQILEQHGAPADMSFSAIRMQAPEFVFRLRKISERIERFPRQIYPDAQNRWIVLGSLARHPVTKQVPTATFDSDSDQSAKAAIQ